jgi:hypothetical protein
MGPAGLTAVFGMGTGVAPPVWSPESGREAGWASSVAWVEVVRSCACGGSGAIAGVAL